MPALIEARNLSKKYGSHVALDNLNLSIEAGRIVGLIGPNGAGKTTALRAMLGLTTYDGELRVLGREPFRERTALMNDACFIADVAVGLDRRGDQWQRLRQLRSQLDPRKEPVLTVVLLAQASQAVGDTAEAEKVLRSALATRPNQVVGPVMWAATHPQERSATTLVYPPIQERLMASLDFWWKE